MSLLFYGTLWETSDVAVSWWPVLMTEAEARYLQAVARQTLLAVLQKHHAGQHTTSAKVGAARLY